MPQVVNVHHYGGLDKLPSNVKYIGRPGPYGNRHSSKSGEYSKEDCVAFHRVDVYANCIEDPLYLPTLKQELGGYDLGCWCKQKHKLSACHGDNYLHVLSKDRVYDKHVYHYLVEDLKDAIDKIKTITRSTAIINDNLYLWLGIQEAFLDVSDVIRLFKERETPAYQKCLWLATLIIDLELFLQEKDDAHRLYRLDRVVWNAFRFAFRPTSRADEPSPPDSAIRKPKKAKKND